MALITFALLSYTVLMYRQKMIRFTKEQNDFLKIKSLTTQFDISDILANQQKKTFADQQFAQSKEGAVSANAILTQYAKENTADKMISESLRRQEAQ